MASIGHIALGLCAARWRHGGALPWRSGLLWSLVSLAPDADVVAFVLRIPYAHPFGHRGASHSVGAAVLAGVVAWLLTRNRRDTALAALVWLSHPLLDAMTDGGLGVALFWPVDDVRVFAPWQPIPVSPIGKGFLSARGLQVALTELVLFLPAWGYALWPRSRAAVGTPKSADSSLDSRAKPPG
jgi:inner membrane protein